MGKASDGGDTGAGVGGEQRGRGHHPYSRNTTASVKWVAQSVLELQSEYDRQASELREGIKQRDATLSKIREVDKAMAALAEKRANYETQLATLEERMQLLRHSQEEADTKLRLIEEESRRFEHTVTSIKQGRHSDVSLADVSRKECTALRTFVGHSAPVSALVVEPNLGQDMRGRCISGSGDKSVRVWDLTTGRTITSWTADAWVRSISLSSSGFLTGDGRGVIQLWSMHGAVARPRLVWASDPDASHSSAVTALHVCEAGNLVASASTDCSIKVWDIATGQAIDTLTGHAAAVTCLHGIDHGLLSGSADGTLRMWDLRSKRAGETRLLGRHASPVNAAVLDPTSFKAYSACNDGVVREWFCASKDARVQREFATGAGAVHDIAIAQRNLIAACKDGQLRVFDIDKGTNVQNVLVGHTGAARVVAASGGYAISGSDDHTIKVWAVRPDQLAASDD